LLGRREALQGLQSQGARAGIPFVLLKSIVNRQDRKENENFRDKKKCLPARLVILLIFGGNGEIEPEATHLFLNRRASLTYKKGKKKDGNHFKQPSERRGSGGIMV